MGRCVLFVLFALAFATPVHAQSAAAEPNPAYLQNVTLGLREHATGNYTEARAHFKKAHDIFPNARTLRGLGLTEFELRNYTYAADYLQRSLDSDVKPLSHPQRVETEALLERTMGYLARVDLDLVPGQADVIVDGRPISLRDDSRLVLEIGDHVLEFKASGHRPARRELRVIGGETKALRIQLDPSPGAAGAQAEVDGGSLRRKWWLWTAVAIGAGVVAGGLVFALRDGGTSDSSGGTTGLVIDTPASVRF